MGEISFWYFWTIWLRKKLKNLILKKSKISGVAQNGSISADGIFRVANFVFNYLRHFFNNFANSCAHLVANFLNFSKHPLKLIIWWFWRELWTKTKKNRCWKICHFEPTLKFNLFWDWDFSTLFLIIWFKSTKMKLRPYFTIELVQKLMKKTQKYLIYSPLTEKVLTEWPCRYVYLSDNC